MNLEHIGIWTEDIELMRRFYMDYFQVGCSEKYVNPKKKYTSYFLTFGEDKARIELMHLADRPDIPAHCQSMRGLAHLAISVKGKEAVEMLTERLRSDGYTIASEPRTTGDGYYESVVIDPEGNEVEICA